MTGRTAQRIVPYLIYEDAPTAIDFLCAAFGFEEQERYRDADRIGHCQLTLAGNELCLASAYRELGFAPQKDLEGVSCQLQVYVDDLDKHHARALAAGASVVEPVEEHGRRSYRAFDPEGHRWIFIQLPTP